jgi:hypothetical protein
MWRKRNSARMLALTLCSSSGHWTQNWMVHKVMGDSGSITGYQLPFFKSWGDGYQLPSETLSKKAPNSDLTVWLKFENMPE